MRIDSTPNSQGPSPFEQLRQKYKGANGGQGLKPSAAIQSDFQQIMADRSAGNTEALAEDKQKLRADFAASLKAQGVTDADLQQLEGQMQQARAAHRGHRHHGAGAQGESAKLTPADPAAAATPASDTQAQLLQTLMASGTSVPSSQLMQILSAAGASDPQGQLQELLAASKGAAPAIDPVLASYQSALPELNAPSAPGADFSA